MPGTGLEASFVHFVPREHRATYRQLLEERTAKKPAVEAEATICTHPIEKITGHQVEVQLNGTTKNVGCTDGSVSERIECTRNLSQEKVPARSGSQPLCRKRSLDLLTGEETSRKRPRLSSASMNPQDSRIQEEEQEEEEREKKPEESNLSVDRSHACPICLGNFCLPSAARCGHVCCNGCWELWLSSRLECPVCREKVRLKQLRRIFAQSF